MLQIIAEPIEFKFFNIKKLNYRFLFTILSVSCSYFIVLLQFEMNV